MTKIGRHARHATWLGALLVLGISGIALASQGHGSRSTNVTAEGDAAGPGATATGDATPETVDKQDEAEIRRVVAQAENVYMAMVYPPPSNARKGSFANDRSAAPDEHLDAGRSSAHLSDADKSAMRSNADTQISKLFTQALGVKMHEIVDHAIDMQDGGTFLAGAGGADVVSFDELVVTGKTAIVDATVRQWAKTGQLDPATHEVRWAEPDAQVNVHLSLVKDATSWRIDTRTWDFVGGGP